jgi:hypothetical protein
LRFRCGLRAAGWQQDQNNRQPECHSHDEPHCSALFPSDATLILASSNINRECAVAKFQSAQSPWQ